MAVGGAIPPEIIAEVRDRADLLNVVQRSVRLERKGRRWVGLCPFHSESTPSFGVSQEKQLYHCFGCGAGGDVYRFIMDTDGLSFPEAVRKLAAEVGVEVPEPDRSPREVQAEKRRQAQFDANSSAAELFRSALAKEAKATAYLRRERGVSEETAEAFAVGFAPDSWDALPKALERRGFAAAAVENGLVGRKQRGDGLFSRFRGRLMFPIRLPDGRVAGFGARRLEWIDPEGPKYLNSPESGIYDKSSVLYGLHEGQRAIRQRHRVILTEGYLDVIALHQAGFQEAVAACGTALTGRHAERIKRWAREVITAYDGDAAGQEATRKAALPLLAAGLEVRVLRLPTGQDPDTFIRSEGADAFAARLERAPSIFDHLVADVRSRAAGGGIAGTTRAVDVLRPLIKAIPDPLKRDVALSAIASALEVHPQLLRKHLTERSRPPAPGPQRTEKPTKSSGFRVSVVEAGILRALLDRPDEMIAALETRMALDAFSTMAFQAAVKDLVVEAKSGAVLTGPRVLERLVASGLEDGISTLRGALMEDLPESDDADVLVSRLLEQRRRATIQRLRRRIESAPSVEERTELERELLAAVSREATTHGN